METDHAPCGGWPVRRGLRILLVDEGARERLVRDGGRWAGHEVRVAESLAEALLDLAQPFERPDLVVTDLDLPDAQGPAALRLLQDAAMDVPVLVCALDQEEGLWPVEAAAELLDPRPLPPGLHEVACHRRTEEQVLAVRRAEVALELERIAREVAEEASGRVLERLGLEDREGLRKAVALARGFELLKARFLGAMAAGLAGGMLLALAVGVLALLRSKLGR